MIKILVIEDDKELNKALCTYLDNNGFCAKGCLNANEAYDAFYCETYNLIISDIMLPGDDGFEIAKNIRLENKEIPILFVTAKDDFSSKKRGFNLGIDDYMVKPVDLDELILRINALLRRARISSSKIIQIGSLSMNAEEYSVYVDDTEIFLTAREFDILFKLLSYPKKTFTRTKLMEEFWNSDTTSTTRTVDVYITKIRDKLSNCNDFKIVTVHGIGYKAVLNNEN